MNRSVRELARRAFLRDIDPDTAPVHRSPFEAPGRSRLIDLSEGEVPFVGDAVCTIGAFDGVHRGHRFLFSATVADARRRGLPSVIMTFDPDPDELFLPRERVRKLLNNGDRLAYLCGFGADYVMSVPFTILQYLFQELMMTAGKPDRAFGVTVVAGVVNIVLDAVLIVGAGLGVAGAAIGTMAGEAAGALIPLVYFMRKNTSNLRLVRTRFDWRTLGRACWNGSSEMVSNIASSVVAMVYNIQLLAYLGEPGGAAYGVIMYAGFLFAAVFLGYCTGCAPLMSYHLGARNGEEMASLFRKSLLIVGVAGVGMFALTRVLVTPLATLFVGYDAGLLELTVHAALLYSFALLVMGFNVYGSSLFTAVGNGHVSALISFVRTFICEIGAVLLVPLALGADGIWLSILVAEAVALVLTAAMTCYLKPFRLDSARKKRK